MKNFFEGLNDAQGEAVRTIDGPILMLAGAGSGKTKTLTHRIAYLVGDKKTPPSDILAVTFTNKAAGEMRSRVARLLGFDDPSANPIPFLGTFHSIANRILRREADKIGLTSNFLIYDSSDSQALIKKILKSMHHDDKAITPSGIAWAISSAKNELVEPDQYRSMATSKLQLVAADVYPVYQREMIKSRALDFDDLIMELVKLFKNQADVLAKYQQQFRYILVDEYQDTNHAQYQLIKMLAAKHQNLCVVGDDWQSIYSWRGANYQNILNFESDYPDAKVIKLEQNYRSTQTILDAAHSVITKNISRSSKKLWTDLGLGERVHVMSVSDELAEGRTIVQTIDRLRNLNPKLRLSDFAVLYRTNAQSRSLEESFLQYNIPYQVVGGTRFYDRREVKDILAYMRVIFQPNDLVSLTRILNVPTRGVGAKSAAAIIDYLDKYEADTISTLAEPSKIPGLKGKALVEIKKLGDILDGLKDYQNLSIYELMEGLIKRIDYIDYLNDGTISAEDRVENVQELLGVAKVYQDMDLETFLTEVALVSDIDSLDSFKETVSMMTLHASKGLEFEVVFMVGMEESIFPHSRTFFEPEELEEERRLCYVGMTRAKQQLYLLHASSRMLYGNTQHNVPSRFISDIPTEMVDQPIGSASNTFTDIARQSFDDDFPDEVDKASVVKGDKVMHPKFGKGVVLEVSGPEVVVKFTKEGIKNLNLQYAPLRKI
ncbi:MAG: UvrD-helicase domain-containing protein [bacterium]